MNSDYVSSNRSSRVAAIRLCELSGCVIGMPRAVADLATRSIRPNARRDDQSTCDLAPEPARVTITVCDDCRERRWAEVLPAQG
jgi:hypothetical protein